MRGSQSLCEKIGQLQSFKREDLCFKCASVCLLFVSNWQTDELQGGLFNRVQRCCGLRLKQLNSLSLTLYLSSLARMSLFGCLL